MRRQAEGLAAAVAALAGGETARASAKNSAFNKLLPRPASFFVAPVLPRPDILIACGSAAVAGALRARREGVFTVFVQKPPLAPHYFGAVVCGEHDNLSGANVLTVAGAVGGVSAETLARRKQRAEEKFAALPRLRTALILGGNNRAYSLTPALCRRILAELRAAAGGGAILATVSRRTGKECRRILAQEPPANFFYGGDGDDGNDGNGNDTPSLTSPSPMGVFNPPPISDGGGGGGAAAENFICGDAPPHPPPSKMGGGLIAPPKMEDGSDDYGEYLDILAAADRIVVTCDSVNMISEACASGKPVYILPLTVANAAAAKKFADFHRNIIARGFARMWAGEFCDWQNAALNETERAARFVCEGYRRARDTMSAR